MLAIMLVLFIFHKIYVVWDLLNCVQLYGHWLWTSYLKLWSLEVSIREMCRNREIGRHLIIHFT